MSEFKPQWGRLCLPLALPPTRPRVSLIVSNPSAFSPFVTGLIDKCEAAMAATDPLSASAGAGAARPGALRRQYVFSGELVRGTQFYGYHEEETVFVRMSVYL